MDLGTAGDPISGKLWYRSTTERVASDLNVLGYQISDRSVSRLLKSMGYSLRVNHKQISRTQHPDRDLQFQMIGVLRALYSLLGYPIVSVDALRRIIVGLFWNKGVAWRKKAIKVFDHDYPSWGSGVANSYGVYDLSANKGAFYVGLSYNTPQFAVDSITRWWETVGCYRYPSAKELLILADSGGSNGYRSRAWKYFLQHQLSTPFGLNVTVAHYPSGASKWNPIEHRLFSEASKRWAGIPLDSIKTILNCSRLHREMGSWNDGPGIYYGTYHSSKGLEFDHVILPFLEDNNLPDSDHILSHGQEDAMTHYGRQIYVAVTRAKSELLLLYTGEVTPLLPKDSSLYKLVSS